MGRNKILIILLAVFRSAYFWAVLVRLGLLAFMNLRIAGDAGEYLMLAKNIAEGHGFSRCPTEPFPPTAQRPPLYPYFLSLFSWLGLQGPKWAGIANIPLDLGSMYFLAAIGRTLNFKSVKRLPWVIAVFPPLVCLSLYPLTESLSVFLFLMATYWSFRSRWVLAGLSWGLLALCRSYMGLFVPLLAVIYYRQKRLNWLQGAKLLVAAAVGPLFWVARNISSVGLVTFSQTSVASLQTFLGVCFNSFDWWNPKDVARVMGVPEFQKILAGHCSPDRTLLELAAQGWGTVQNCVAEDPLGTVGNVAIKGVNGLFNFGRLFIYDETPELFIQLVYGVMVLVWIRAIFLIRSTPFRTPQWKQGVQYLLITLAYLFTVTLPFGLDARYFLQPVLWALMLAVESAVCSASLNRHSRPHPL